MKKGSRKNKVEKNFSTIVVPFRYSSEARARKYTDIFDTNANDSKIIWRKKNLNFNYLNENIVGMLTDQSSNEPICVTYEYDVNSKKVDGIPKIGPQSNLHLTYNGEIIEDAKLLEVTTTLFYSGIGFFCMKFEFLNNDAEKIREGVYYLTQVKRDKFILKYEEKTGRDKIVEKETTLIDLMNNLVSGYIDTDGFDWDNQSYSNNVLMSFTYILFDKFPDNFKEYASNITHNQKDSYRIIPNEQDFYQPYMNEYFVFSLSGVMCAASLTGDDKTDNFFKIQQHERCGRDYFYLFLLRQHQRFLIRDLEKNYISTLANIKSRKKVDGLYLDGINMKLKCDYDNPASIDHINNYDEYLKSHLHIEKDSNKFMDLSKRLIEYSSLLKDKEDKKKELKLLKNTLWTLIPTAMWTTFTAANQAIEGVNKFVGSSGVSYFIGLVLGAATLVTQVIGILRVSEEIKELEGKQD